MLSPLGIMLLWRSRHEQFVAGTFRNDLFFFDSYGGVEFQKDVFSLSLAYIGPNRGDAIRAARCRRAKHDEER
jgi:hypothetical protein